MKVLVTGCNGMLGTDLMLTLSQNHDLIGTDIDDFDITDINCVINHIKEIKPDIVIHSAAYTNVDSCESEHELAYRVNALGARNVAVACNEINAALVYISTDYVFDGAKGSSYMEEDETNPLSIYGKSKLAGENFVRSLVRKHYIVRTQWLYGKNGKNFVTTMLKLAGEKDTISVVNDQYGSPTYTPDLAQAISQLILEPIYGTYHITNNGTVSWFEFAKDIFRIAGVEDIEVIPVSTETLNRPAPRPKYSPLDNFYWKLNGYELLRDYKEALADYIKII